MEEKAAVDSGVCVVAEEGGTVERSTSTEITVRQDDGKLKKYKLTKFQRSNPVSYTHLDVYKRQASYSESGKYLVQGIAINGLAVTDQVF